VSGLGGDERSIQARKMIIQTPSGLPETLKAPYTFRTLFR